MAAVGHPDRRSLRQAALEVGSLRRHALSSWGEAPVGLRLYADVGGRELGKIAACAAEAQVPADVDLPPLHQSLTELTSEFADPPVLAVGDTVRTSGGQTDRR